MSSAASPYPTLYEILKTVRPSSQEPGAPSSVVEGISPATFQKSEGLITLRAEQLLNVRIPLQRRSEHECLYCCLCFKSLTRKECAYLPDGSQHDVCVQCAEEEQKMLVKIAQDCKCRKTRGADKVEPYVDDPGEES